LVSFLFYQKKTRRLSFFPSLHLGNKLSLIIQLYLIIQKMKQRMWPHKKFLSLYWIFHRKNRTDTKGIELEKLDSPEPDGKFEVYAMELNSVHSFGNVFKGNKYFIFYNFIFLIDIMNTSKVFTSVKHGSLYLSHSVRIMKNRLS
jgi:hypothetical protein